jgi:hypothetical protein
MLAACDDDGPLTAAIAGDLLIEGRLAARRRDGGGDHGPSLTGVSRHIRCRTPTRS